MKKIVALLLAVLMLLTLLASCAEEPVKKKKKKDTDEDTQTATEETLSMEESASQEFPGGSAGIIEKEDLSARYTAEVKDLGGHKFRFYVKTSFSQHLDTKEIYAEAPNGDKINDAVYERNSQLEAKYNCTIIEERGGISVSSYLREPLIAGEYVCDYAFAGPRDLANLATHNLLVDFNEVSNLDLTKAWWDPQSLDGMNIGGKIFYLAGSASNLDDIAAWIMAFNKDHVREYEADIDLYQEVRDGKWTVDRMYEIMSHTWKDLNGDGVMTVGTDRFGYIADPGANYAHILSCGAMVPEISSNGDIYIPEQPNRKVMDAWAKLKPLLTSYYRDVSDAPTRLRSGYGTFTACNMGTVVMKAGQPQVPMGILPMPKYDESQEFYYTSVNDKLVGCFAIPTTVENDTSWEDNGFNSGAEQAAYFLEAFGYYSMIILKPAFYDEVVIKQNATDTSSAEMVEIALGHKIYDPLQGFGWGSLTLAFNECGNGGIYQPSTDINYENLVSTYTARVQAARKQMNRYIQAINTAA